MLTEQEWCPEEEEPAPGVPMRLLLQVGRALLGCDFLEGLCSSFAFVHFSALKGLHQGSWLSAQDPSVSFR